LEYQTLIVKRLCHHFSERAFIGAKFPPLQDESFRHYTMKFFYGWPFIKVDCAETGATTISAKTRNVLRCFIMICLGLIFYNKYSKI
jgi:hypothetical protein